MVLIAMTQSENQYKCYIDKDHGTYDDTNKNYTDVIGYKRAELYPLCIHFVSKGNKI